MAELPDRFKDCLLEAMKQDLDFEDTIYEALETYIVLNGGPLQVEDEEEGVEVLNLALSFVVDATLGNLVEKGIIDVAGVDPDGEIVYTLSYDAEVA